MSYIVPGKFPTSCSGCHLFNLDDRDLWCIANHYAGCCRVLSKYIDENKFVNERHPDCPLIEVPTPHGRLIDADKLNTYDLSPVNGFCVMGVTEEDIGLADTVIEAED